MAALLQAPGNVDMLKRPAVRNADGSVSSVRSMSIGTDRGEVLIPTVSDDARVLSDDEAIAQFERTGQNLGTFATPEDATAYADWLHNQEAARTDVGGPGIGLPAHLRGQALGLLLERADATQRSARSRLGGPGASAPIADAGAFTFPGAPPLGGAGDFVAGIRAQPPAVRVEEPPRPGVLGLLQRPAVSAEEAATLAPFLTPEGMADLNVEGTHSTDGVPAALLPQPQPPLPRVIGTPLQGDPGSTFDHDPNAPQVPADVADLTGGAGRPSQPRGGRRGVRSVFRAPPPPPTEEELNERLIAELTARPADDAPLVPADSRGESPLEVQERQLDERAQLERATADQAAIRAADLADQEAALQEQRARVQEQRQAALTGARQRYEGALEKAASMSIEPERFYRSRGLLGQVGAAIAMAVGAFAEGATGAPNRAAQIIDGAITRDIEAQRMNIANAREAAEGQRGVYQLMRQEYDDENAALDATRAAMLTEAARRAEIEGAQAQSEDARLRANELRTRLEAEARQAQEQASMREALALLEARRALAETVKLEGDARTSLANATRAERRAMGGGGPARPRPITQQQMETFNQLRNSGFAPAEAATRAGIDPSAVPAGGNFSTVSDQEAGNLAALQSSLRRIEELMPADGEDVPGFGRFAGNLPDFLVTEEGVELREEFANANDLMGRLRSGGAIGEQEMQSFTAILQGTTDESARRGLARIQREIQARSQRRIPGSRSADLERSSAAVGFTPESSE